MTADDRTAAAAGRQPIEAVSFHGLAAGPRLIVLGAVHGNEACGPAAIGRAIDECRSGAIWIRRGTVTFVPVVNAKAHAQGTREGDRNLNRNLLLRPVAADNEDRVGNVLCRLLAAHDVLLDIHSFSSEGPPFVFLGPESNDGALEPFAKAAAELAFASALGPDLLMHGWLDGFERLIRERRQAGLGTPEITEGFGTTEYMRFAGGYGVTIECGRHDDPAAPAIAHRAILGALAHLGLVECERRQPVSPRVLRIAEMMLCRAPGDRLVGRWRTGDPAAAGAKIGRRAEGSPIVAPTSGYVVFPKPDATPGECICYFAVDSPRAGVA
jgi:predicted deacylase